MTLLKFLTANKEYKKVKLAKIETQHLTLNAKINNVNGIFILDTGASSTVIDKFAEDKFLLKISETNDDGVGAGSSNLQIALAKNNTLGFGNLKLKNFALALLDLTHINDALAKVSESKVDGVIGADVLLKCNGIIDYEKLNLFLKYS